MTKYLEFLGRGMCGLCVLLLVLCEGGGMCWAGVGGDRVKAEVGWWAR